MITMTPNAIEHPFPGAFQSGLYLRRYREGEVAPGLPLKVWYLERMLSKQSHPPLASTSTPCFHIHPLPPHPLLVFESCPSMKCDHALQPPDQVTGNRPQLCDP